MGTRGNKRAIAFFFMLCGIAFAQNDANDEANNAGSGVSDETNQATLGAPNDANRTAQDDVMVLDEILVTDQTGGGGSPLQLGL
ncbi:MAG: hypothetical protein LBP89_02740 [Helicobacteraceae bacterium]|jgi:hypothetical protein|nr:hypothetical protein [Helicobacteraceae bacterium]